jgi:hypothetical protein
VIRFFLDYDAVKKMLVNASWKERLSFYAGILHRDIMKALYIRVKKCTAFYVMHYIYIYIYIYDLCVQV